MHFLVTPLQRDHIQRIMRLSMSRRLRLLWAVLRDYRITPMMEAPLVAAVAYVLIPLNLVPRRLFIIRAFDDIIVAAAGLWLFVRLVPAVVLEEHLRRVEGGAEED
jgi:uncharacterized membrane protein YkvA (DUF1232 family)